MIMVGDYVVWIWVGVVIALLLVEMMSKNFSSICFAISGIISCLLTHFTKNYFIQVGEFLIVGCLIMGIIRPRVLPLIESKLSKVTESKPKENKKEKNKQISNKKNKKKTKRKK